LLSSQSDLKSTEGLSVAYQDNQNSSPIGPIVLTTPVDYTKTKLAYKNPDATCWEVLTLRLGKFAREQIEKHGPGSVTDNMLQSEARNILYGNDDPWEQTSADNPEWLNLFKKAHGIDMNAPTPKISTYHEVYEDLGINGSTTLDVGFNIDNFPNVTISKSGVHLAEAFNLALSGSSHLPSQAHQLSADSQSPLSLPGLPGSMTASPISPASQIPNADTTEPFLGVFEPISEMSCPGPGGPCYGENGEVGFATKSFGSLQVLKKSYWLGPSASHLAPEHVLKDVGASHLALADRARCHNAVEPVPEDFQFPSWAQHQCPTDLLDLQSTSAWNPPVSSCTAGADVCARPTAAPADATVTWDDHELNFAMDMDMDMDIGFDLTMLENESRMT